MAGSSMKPSPTGTDRLGKDDGMKKGGKVKKYADGGDVKKYQTLEEYQDRPDYWGFEDTSPVGVKAREAAEKEFAKPNNKGPYDSDKNPNPRKDAILKAAQNVIAKDREQVKTMSNVDPMGNPLKKGGSVKMKSGGKVTAKVAGKLATRGYGKAR